VAADLKDSRQLHERDITQLQAAITALPPEAWRERIVTLEKQDKEMQAVMTSLLMGLEQIKFKLGISKESGEP
jgi:rRNA maturation endonuclease Nob1